MSVDKHTHPHIEILLFRVEYRGATMVALGPEGHRRPGHCVYCAGQCLGVTGSCVARVWSESTAPEKALYFPPCNPVNRRGAKR